MSEVITLVEAAYRLGVSARRVRQLVEQERIDGVIRLGGEGRPIWAIRVEPGRVPVIKPHPVNPRRSRSGQEKKILA